MTSDSKNETEKVNNPKDPSTSLALPTERNSVRHNLKKNPKPYRLDEVSEFDKQLQLYHPQTKDITLDINNLTDWKRVKSMGDLEIEANALLY